MIHSKKGGRRSALALGVIASVMLAGCSGQPAAPEAETAELSQEAIDEAMSAKTTIDFWTWVPNSEIAVEAFEKKYPNITVNLVQTNSREQEQRLRTAISAGTGVPDVVQLQDAAISSFVLTKDLLDLAPYGAADLKSEFAPAAWKAVSVADGVYAVPQDIAPMAMLYRTDLFEQAGVQIPTTWEEFAEAAPIIKEKTGSYIANVSTVELQGYVRQGATSPLTDWDGNTGVTVDVSNSETKQVTQYWQDLIDKDLVSTQTILTDSWFQGMSAGKYATWTAGAWAPVFLKEPAASSAGLWRVAPMPRWSSDTPVSVNLGGASTAVSATTKNPIVAAQFALWLNASNEGASLNMDKLSLFPSTTTMLNDPAFTEREDPFFGGQNVNSVFSEMASESVQDTPVPFSGYYTSSLNDTVGAALANGTSIVDAFAEWQESLSTYATSQGFTTK
ncbi:sugar ABC transporter substrate-binding protein [Microbacterium resistens]|uniref:ABC transporter substrate-binding protein n=1 Tax=Microbacterium resistens TaxID=156977 RepID=UPI001C57695D|nr:sugar ABC transporter substrate-binding protein [Microbacterium resistens]MBW1639732.1 sugar ABC transporter substrate-binding protein [Microbacterium resistens]